MRTYHYLVRAVESTTGLSESNAVEVSTLVTGLEGLEGCVTAGTPGPPPVPDGGLGTTPVRLDYLPGFDVIGVTWDVVSCTADSYNLLYGHLDDVGSYKLLGSRCDIGTSGEYSWLNVPNHDLYFLIVGADAWGLESSWGTDSNELERNGAEASGECSGIVKETSSSCP
jgi:hypothetical protein